MAALNNPTEVLEILRRELREKVEQILGSDAVKVRVEDGWGRPDAHLLELAKVEQADLIVAGTHQRRGVDRFWLGSVSRAILHHASASVAIVPAPKLTETQATPIPEIRRVLVSTDFSELANRAILYAFAAVRSGGTVRLVHVVSEAREQKGDHELESKLRVLVPADANIRGIKSEVEILESPQVAAAICQAAERFGADLICMASHGRSGLSKAILGSVAHDVMTCSKRPLLVVRPPED